MNHYKDELNRITGVLLEPEDDYVELTKAIEDLNRLFLTVSGLEMEVGESREDIFLETGKAIGPAWAALCVKEFMRTKRFICGCRLGIKSALEKFPGRPIHVLYAGTGPFATLAIPLTTVFSPEEVKFTFLEINPVSIRSLEKVIEAFSAGEYVNEIICCDATKYRADENRPIHVVITETMLNALQKEPQVAITLNLVPQMENGGVLIPQNIKVEAGLMSPSKNTERMRSPDGDKIEYYRMLGTLLELNRNSPEIYPSHTFPEVAVHIPGDIPEDYKQLCLFTTIQVFGEEQLTHWQCSLNIPQNIAVLGRDKSSADRIGFQYIINEKPGFRYRVLE